MRVFMYLKSFLVECKDQFALHIQYNGCQCPGSVEIQGICSHGIDLIIIPDYSGFRARGVDTSWDLYAIF